MLRATSTMQRFRFFARLLGTVQVFFLIALLLGALLGDAEDVHGFGGATGREQLAFLFFPVFTLVGLALAFRWDLAGGLLALASLVVLVALRPAWMQPTLLVMAVPGLLFAAVGLMAKLGVSPRPGLPAGGKESAGRRLT